MTADPMHVLMVADGESVHTRRLATALDDAGVQTSLSAFEGEPLPNVSFHRLGSAPASSDWRYPMAVPRLVRIIRTLRPDIVHAHYLSSYGLLTWLAMLRPFPRRPRPPVIQSAWGTDVLLTATSSRLRRAASAAALRAAHLATADSDDARKAIGDLAPDTPYFRFVFGPNQRLLTSKPRSEPVFVSLRALSSEMRVPLVVRAFLHARERDHDAMSAWRLCVVGDGPLRGEVQKLASRDASVEVRGAVTHDAVEDALLAAASIVSVPVSDASSASLLEGLAAGLVPIVNDLPANREWVDESIGEVVAPNPTVEELAAAMTRVARSWTGPVPGIRERVAPVIWERQVASLIEQYDQLRVR